MSNRLIAAKLLILRDCSKAPHLPFTQACEACRDGASFALVAWALLPAASTIVSTPPDELTTGAGAQRAAPKAERNRSYSEPASDILAVLASLPSQKRVNEVKTVYLTVRTGRSVHLTYATNHGDRRLAQVRHGLDSFRYFRDVDGAKPCRFNKSF